MLNVSQLVQDSLIYGTKEEVKMLLNDTRIDPMTRFVSKSITCCA